MLLYGWRCLWVGGMDGVQVQHACAGGMAWTRLQRGAPR